MKNETTEYGFYSKLLKKPFDTLDELKEAEDAYNKAHAEEISKAEERKRRAKEVEDAHAIAIEIRNRCAKEIQEADKKYIKLRNAFVKDYGSYHTTYTSTSIQNWEDLFNDLLNFNLFR